MRFTVLIVDAAERHGELAAMLERSERLVTECFAVLEHAENRVREAQPDAIVYAIDPDVDATVGFTRRLREMCPLAPMVAISDPARADAIEEVLRAGATDFMMRPFDPAALVIRVNLCLQRRLVPYASGLPVQIRQHSPAIVGSHPLTTEVRNFATHVGAVSDMTALLRGESGTGKGLVARAIHAASPRAHLPFVELNCAAIPPDRLEPKLFGGEKGAVRGAEETKGRLVDAAEGGTLFLREVALLPLRAQTRLLAFLESRGSGWTGSTQDGSVKPRIIAATTYNLLESVRAGVFRGDLYYRLNVASHVLPPLWRIRSDIPALIEHFTVRAAEHFGKVVPEIDPGSLDAFADYEWPGNARELRNAVERAMIFATGAPLAVEPTIPASAGGKPESLPVGLTLAELERRYIELTLEALGGNVNAAADQLGVTRKVLWQRRRRHRLL